jgi:hypothetical protein
MVSCKKSSRMIGPKEKKRVSLLIALLVGLDVLPPVVIMGLQPQQLMLGPDSPFFPESCPSTPG